VFEHKVIDLRSHLVRKWAKQTEFSQVHSQVHDSGKGMIFESCVSMGYYPNGPTRP